MLLSACAARPPEPTRVSISIETSGDINPNPTGRPSPLTLRIYQLKSPSSFQDADFMSLYEKEDAVLGRDLAKREEVLLKANEKRNVNFEAEMDTTAIGLLAVFREYEQAQGKATAALIPHKSNQFNVIISGTTISVK